MPETSLLGHQNTNGSPAVEGSPNAFIGTVPVLRQGDRFADGSTVLSGAPHATVSGRPVARLGDPVTDGLAVAKGCPRVRIGNGGGPEYGKLARLRCLRKELAATAAKEDNIILCLPDIAETEAGKAWASADEKGWLYLRELMLKWLQRPAKRYPNIAPEPFWVDWDWVVSFVRARDAYNAYTLYYRSSEPNNIYNTAARRQIGSYLKRDGKLTARKEPFDYTQGTWRDRVNRSFQYRSVDRGWIDDGLQAAIGAFTFRALAKGYAEPNSTGGHAITVTGVSVFMEDRFSFQEGELLGYWNCELKEFIQLEEFPFYYSLPSTCKLTGSHFLRFQERHNCGNDFLTLTEPHAVENFREMRYDWP